MAIVYHSGYGHTKKLAESVLEGSLIARGVKRNLLTFFQLFHKDKDLQNNIQGSLRGLL